MQDKFELVTPPLLDSHTQFMKQMQYLGYKVDLIGVCFGVAHMGMQAILSLDLDTFDKRLVYLSKLIIDNISLMKEIKQSRVKNNNLSNVINLAFDIPAFFDGVYLYQYQRFHPQIVGKTTMIQDAHQVIPITIPKELENDKAGIIQIGNFSGAYTEEDLILYFESMVHSIEHFGFALTRPITLILHSSNHVISVGYDLKKKSWYYIDANHLPTKYIESSNVAELARKVIEGFSVGSGLIRLDECPNDTLKKYERSQYLFTKEGLFFYSILENKLHKINCNEQQLEQISLIFSENNTINKLSYEQLSQITSITGHSLSKHEPAIFDTKIYGVTSDEQGLTQIKEAWQADEHWKEIHQISPAKARLIDTYHSSWHFIAAQFGHLNVLEDLLSNGSEINPANNKGSTSLHVASQNGHLDIVKKLLEKDIHVNQADFIGYTPLHLAAMFGQIDVVHQLVDKGAEVFNTETIYGRTALHLAANNNHFEVVEALVKKGALSVNKMDYDDKSPFQLAATKGYFSICSLLEKDSDLVRADNDLSRSLLHSAVLSQKLNLILALLRAGIDSNCVDSEEKTPLDLLLSKECALLKKFPNNSLAIAHALISYGAKITQDTFFSALIDHNYHSILSLFLEKNPLLINQSDNKGNTPLHIAVINGNNPAARALANKGASINQSNQEGETPLILVAKQRNFDMLKFFAKKNASKLPDVQDEAFRP